MLTMNNVSYAYRKKGSRHFVLEGVNQTFEPGKVYAIYGPSGAGKTTCLSLLGGLDQPVGGTVELDGTDIRRIGGGNLRKTQVSYVFQDYHLFTYMTALENVLLAASISKLPKEESRETALRLLRELGIDDADLNRPVRETSGGQQQRVAIARALISNPTYLLADEPTGNLDTVNTLTVAELLEELAHRQKKCVVIATHSELIRERADVKLELVKGKLELEGFGERR